MQNFSGFLALEELLVATLNESALTSHLLDTLKLLRLHFSVFAL